MEEEIENLKELEQELYAQIYHDNNTSAMQIDNEISSTEPRSSNRNSSRYWQSLKSNDDDASKPTTFKQKPRIDYRKNVTPSYRKVSITQSNEVEKGSTLKPYFVPYTSVLAFMNNPQPVNIQHPEKIKDKILEPEQPTSYEKKKSKVTKYPKDKGKFLKPSKELTKLKYEEKKIKAKEVRNKKNKSTSATKTSDVIDLATSSDDDSVIHIETPGPPLINLDSSDDEARKRKKKAASPSTSSMISDDFIVASDKRRLINPFSNSNPDQLTTVSDRLKDVLNENDKMRKIKALTKISSSSSNSARSSCERNIGKDELNSSKNSSNNRRKDKREKMNISNDADESIYNMKASTSKKDTTNKSQSCSSSDFEDNSICVTAKDVRNKRRRSTGSRKGKDSEENEDDFRAGSTSTPLAPQKKRSRFLTPNYNEDEFASLISTVIQQADEETNDALNSSNALLKAIENDELVNITNVEGKDQLDCEIIEKEIETYNVSDEDEKRISDSDKDSIIEIPNDIEYNLTLNIKESDNTPHELIPIDSNSKVESVREVSTSLDCEVGWNDEMKFYYNECTIGRDFCITTIRNSMPIDNQYWRINYTDKTRMAVDHDRKIRCRNCNEWGHKERYCPRPRKKIICYMCGEIGHRETRCPNSICLRCGKPNDFYATMCGNCSKFAKKICPLCHMKGHDIDQCPDKWRRYHSTTTVTDSQTLDISYTQNKRIYCSLCARCGHFAENCSYASKLFNNVIKSSWFVISNKPSYPTNYSFNPLRENEHLLQLITYLENYSFNLKIPSNCQFYPRFKEAFLRHKEKLKMKELPAKRSKQKKRKEKSNEISDEKRVNVAATSIHHNDDSNSNYSFSEFYKSNVGATKNQTASNHSENQIISDRNNPQTLSDYVPLVSVNRNVNESNQVIEKTDDSQRICDSKVMLTKEHTSILMSEKGQNLLFDLGERFNIISQFKTDSMGNSICLTGLPMNQHSFHVEMKDFLYKCRLDQYEKMIEKTTQIPKIISRTVAYVKSNFQSVKHSSIRETKQLLDKLSAAEKSHDHRKTFKCRKALNIIFIGHTELGDGAKHKSELRKILVGLEKEIESGNGDALVDPKLRNEISIHIRYIFSAVDHSNLYGDYRKMYEEYRKIMMKRANSRNVSSYNNFNTNNR